MELEAYQYKTELHLHTSPVSKCSDIPPREAIELYAALGYDTLVVTNHLTPEIPYLSERERCIQNYLSDYEAAYEAGKELGVTVLLGCELRFEENTNDYLLYGINREDFNLMLDSLSLGIESFSKAFRRENVLLIQAHPFRNSATRIDACLLDGAEAFNVHPHHNSRVALAAKYTREHCLIPTVGTDFHHHGHEGLSSLRTRQKITTSQELVKVLRSRDYLFEISGSIVIP